MKALVAAAALILAACGEPDVTVTTLPKSPEAAAAARDLITWTLPKGWRQEAGEGLRYATLLAGPVGEGYEVSVTRMEGDAGGPLANVNRWREQLNLPALDEAGLRRASSKVKSEAGEAYLVDLAARDLGGKPVRTLAAGLMVGGSSWFFKVSGASRELAPIAPQFKELLKSLRRRG